MMNVKKLKMVVFDKENNPLKNAPHTVEDLIGEWNKPYS